jgi:hypothetical protein
MKTLLHACCVVLSLAPTFALADGWTRQLSNAADAVEDAYDRTQRSNGRCRNDVGPSLNGLVDRIDDLKKQRAPLNELNQLRFELATIGQRAPYAACPIGVTEDVQRGLDALEDARVALWNDPGRDKEKSRRDKRRGNGNGQENQGQSQFVQLAPISVNAAVPYQNELAV